MRFELVRVKPPGHAEKRYEAIRSFDSASPYSCWLQNTKKNLDVWSATFMKDNGKVLTKEGDTMRGTLDKLGMETGHLFEVIDEIETIDGKPIGNVILRKLEREGMIKKK